MISNTALLALLNRIPITGDHMIWWAEIRDGLLGLFDDVDKIAISLDFGCDFAIPPALSTITATNLNDGSKQQFSAASTRPEGLAKNLESDTEKFLDLTKFHTPRYFHYYHDGHYMGSIIFFRYIENPATSQDTFEAMSSMEPFFKYVFASFIAMRRSMEPFETAFRAAQTHMEKDGKLSTQECQIMSYRLNGHSYKQIAAKLDISLNTVRQHMKTIHKKTGTRSYSELFAKYFVVPRGEPLPYASTKM